MSEVARQGATRAQIRMKPSIEVCGSVSNIETAFNSLGLPKGTGAAWGETMALTHTTMLASTMS